MLSTSSMMSSLAPGGGLSVILRGGVCSLLPVVMSNRWTSTLTSQPPKDSSPGHLYPETHPKQGSTEFGDDRIHRVASPLISLLHHGQQRGFANLAEALPMQHFNLPTGPNPMRSIYPVDFWKHITTRLFPDLDTPNTPRPLVVDEVIENDGRGTVELASRGFQVIAIEPDCSHLAHTLVNAQAINPNLDIEVRNGTPDHLPVPDGVADMVTFLHGLHLVETKKALQEAWRVLKPGGRVVAAWNDRSLDSHFSLELESILEKHVKSYTRLQKQHSMEDWTEILQAEGLFKLVEYSRYSNPMMLPSPGALLNLINNFNFVKSTLKEGERKQFLEEVKSVLERRYGDGPFALPLETKMYVLVKMSEEARLHRRYHRSMAPLGALVLGSVVNEAQK